MLPPTREAGEMIATASGEVGPLTTRLELVDLVDSQNDHIVTKSLQ